MSVEIRNPTTMIPPSKKKHGKVKKIHEVIRLIHVDFHGYSIRVIRCKSLDPLVGSLRQGLVGCAAGHQVTEELAIRLGEAGVCL